jgi:hypothetical protein
MENNNAVKKRIILLRENNNAVKKRIIFSLGK